MTKEAVTRYTMYDEGDGLVEVLFEDDTWIASALIDDFEGNIDEVNEWVMDEFNIELDNIDWRDPNTLWIQE